MFTCKTEVVERLHVVDVQLKLEASSVNGK